jgi:hypothetical protein
MTDKSFDTTMMLWSEKAISDITNTSVSSHAFHHVQMYRTQTEMEISVLSDVHFPTPDSKYWQTVREMNVFVGTVTVVEDGS